jgi:membrane-anchored protein YejM (alkaline phosphatase superfamily)
MYGYALIVLGVVAILWAQWYWPRQMLRIRQRLAQREKSTNLFDATLTSRAYRVIVAGMTAVGAIGIVVGVVLVLGG